MATSPDAVTDIEPIRSSADYIESLRGRNLKVYLFGELVDEPVDHPMIRPSINAVAATYDLNSHSADLQSMEVAIRFLTATGVSDSFCLACPACPPCNTNQRAKAKKTKLAIVKYATLRP